jgi:hypothetical protein
MSINIGVPVNGLPPPAATNVIQSYVDPWGEVWVARSSNTNGQWRKARDVLHAICYRNAAYPMPGSNAVVPYDTVLADNFGLYVGSPTYGFTVPVPGWYWMQATCNGNCNATGQYIQGYINQNGTAVFSENNITAIASGGLSWRAWGDLFCAAGDTINASAYNPTGLAAQVGALNTRLEISYLGTG